MNKMMQIALIRAPLFSRAKIKQPSNLQSCKRNIAHFCLARQHLMISYEYRIIGGIIFFWLGFVDASKI
jgi:hypothetical protein